MPAEPLDLVPGRRFDTPFEAGCVVFSAPDTDGNFLAWDSDNVLCEFSVVMVSRVGELLAYPPPSSPADRNRYLRAAAAGLGDGPIGAHDERAK